MSVNRNISIARMIDKQLYEVPVNDRSRRDRSATHRFRKVGNRQHYDQYERIVSNDRLIIPVYSPTPLNLWL